MEVGEQHAVGDAGVRGTPQMAREERVSGPRIAQTKAGRGMAVRINDHRDALAEPGSGPDHQDAIATA
jgi:hypothetical protein